MSADSGIKGLNCREIRLIDLAFITCFNCCNALNSVSSITSCFSFSFTIVIPGSCCCNLLKNHFTKPKLPHRLNYLYIHSYYNISFTPFPPYAGLFNLSSVGLFLSVPGVCPYIHVTYNNVSFVPW